MKYLLLLFMFLVSSASFIWAQEISDWKLSGQIQIRSEVDGRDLYNKTHPISYANMRTRLGLEKGFTDKVVLFIQVEDSRVFGSETSVTANLKNLDLHQGFVKLMNPLDLPMTVQAGRFEISYGTERFLGKSDWNYIGRSWDGARISFNPGIKLDLFALTQSEPVTYYSQASPVQYPINDVPTSGVSLYGLWSTANIDKSNQFDFFGYDEVNRVKNINGKNQLQRYTIGINHLGSFGPFNTVFEAGYQFGKYNQGTLANASVSPLDISAYLVSFQGYYQFSSYKFGLGADLVSGASITSTKYNSFNVGFGTNHKFYGSMDYFPIDKYNGGLNDFYAMFTFIPSGSLFSGSVNLHQFAANQNINKEHNTFGQEIDLSVKYNFVKSTSITWGGSFFVPGSLMKLQYAAPKSDRGQNTGFWSYVMLTSAL